MIWEKSGKYWGMLIIIIKLNWSNIDKKIVWAERIWQLMVSMILMINCLFTTTMKWVLHPCIGQLGEILLKWRNCWFNMMHMLTRRIRFRGRLFFSLLNASGYCLSKFYLLIMRTPPSKIWHTILVFSFVVKQ